MFRKKFETVGLVLAVTLCAVGVNAHALTVVHESAADFIDAPDLNDGAGIWSYWTWNGSEASSSLMSNYSTASNVGTDGGHGSWKNTDDAFISANSNGDLTDARTDLAPRVDNNWFDGELWMHPGGTSDTAVSWLALADATITIEYYVDLRLNDVPESAPSDGVAWSLLKNGTAETLDSGVSTVDMPYPALASTTISVSEGDRVWLERFRVILVHSRLR